MATENEMKKEYLRGYRQHVRKLGRIEAELEELRTMKTAISVNNDGMPPGQSDMSDYAAELDQLERKLLEERHRRVMAYKDIVRRIKSLRSESELDVLFYRYIKGLAWWEIAEKMNYSERWVLKIHGGGARAYKITKRVHRNSVQSVILWYHREAKGKAVRRGLLFLYSKTDD